jgi:hypothetical protein
VVASCRINPASEQAPAKARRTRETVSMTRARIISSSTVVRLTRLWAGVVQITKRGRPKHVVRLKDSSGGQEVRRIRRRPSHYVLAVSDFNAHGIEKTSANARQNENGAQEQSEPADALSAIEARRGVRASVTRGPPDDATHSPAAPGKTVTDEPLIRATQTAGLRSPTLVSAHATSARYTRSCRRR